MVRMTFCVSNSRLLTLFIPVLENVEQIYVQNFFALFGVFERLFSSLLKALQSGVRYFYISASHLKRSVESRE